MIKTNSIDHLIKLKEVISKLKLEIIPEYCLSNMANVQIMGMKDLIMKLEIKPPNNKIVGFTMVIRFCSGYFLLMILNIVKGKKMG